MRYEQEEPRPPVRAHSPLERGKASALAYLVFWVSGIVMLFVGRDDPEVKYHAAQSTILFGSLSVAILVLEYVASALTGSWLAVFVQVLIWGVVLYWIVSWAYSLYLSWQSNGTRFDVPLLGEWVTPFAEWLSDAVG